MLLMAWQYLQRPKSKNSVPTLLIPWPLSKCWPDIHQGTRGREEEPPYHHQLNNNASRLKHRLK